MPERVFRGRYTAELDEQGAVVFLIGMRFNHWWRADKWWRVVTAMPRMLRHLESRDAGLLGWKMWFGRTILLVQYWRSLDELHTFATDSSAPHAAAWRDFNRRIGGDGTVGIWHETYRIGPGSAESVYDNMPAFGLAAATRHVPVGRGRETAKARLAHGTESERA
ncbi:uncharacterized protein DUF4188 [Halopolyspora algeriensis]|uniref:Uncharacterized protein DUF4188 n=1 Tax=Halopolyspora algeriensis TaxID=1500506 RepID=A0A368VH98_9ACTN|nr:DUF4188 domain-containing protein [Halopolyspora algeriensis]RCW40731.1 uncharacterized protein DUF4188 [Halopolyspora algeriensis]TQM53350.1 uncharacterized protein DUF4188 [Halopolyspora algeriensis]